MNGQSFSTVQSSSCVALVSWDVDLFGQPQISSSVPLAESDSFARPVRINSFLYSIGSEPQVKFESNVFVSVSWYCTHPGYISFGKPVQLWCSSIFEVRTLPTFIPVSLLSTRCVHCVTNCNV